MADRFQESRLLMASTLVFAAALSTDSAVRQLCAATPTRTNSRSLADAGQKKPEAMVASPKLDAETETAASNLVKAHLPELREVLDRLRKDQPRQYDRAVRDLARTAKKLDLAKNRDEHLYEMEVELLKAQTDVNLLTAKLKVRDSQSDRALLRKAVARLLQASIARSEYDVQALQLRLERTKQQLAAANGRLDEKRKELDTQVEANFLSLLRKAGRQSEADTAADKKPSGKSKKK